jgi:hypothetical protein
MFQVIQRENETGVERISPMAHLGQKLEANLTGLWIPFCIPRLGKWGENRPK